MARTLMSLTPVRPSWLFHPGCTGKNRPQVRVRGNALEIQSGKRWLDYTHTALSAQ